ncbi:MAG: TonB-dependent receptor [Chitinophagaceae bacterium]|nr:TonB-dependent receptor [Chitinophagaceae bacterium]
MQKIQLLAFCLFVCLVMQAGLSQAQVMRITGRITDNNGAAVPRASIEIKGTTRGTLSDATGNYSLEVQKGNTLVFSNQGYATQEIVVNNQSVINVSLMESVQQLSEVLVTGYTTERKRDLLGAVAVADVPSLRDVSYPNVLQTLAGRLSGVNIDLAGIPGQGAKVKIRGIKTLGNNEPLYIVDGVPLQSFESVGTETGMAERVRQPTTLDLSWLNPSDIESIQVLKDAASASIYGSRASNGVVIITTRQAKLGKPTISFNARYSVDKVNYRAWVPNSQQEATLAWRGAVNQGIDPNTVSQYFKYNWHYDPTLGPGFQGLGEPVLENITYPDWLDESDQLRIAGHPQSKYGGDINVGTDWQDVAYRTGRVQNYDLQFSQGYNNGGIRLSANYYDQQGVLLGNSFKRYTARMNANIKFFDNRLTLGENLTLSTGRRHWGLATAIGPSSILPPYTEDGRIAGPPPGFDRTDNPIGTVDNDKWDKNNNLKVFGNVYLEAEIIKNLKFRSSFGVDYDNVSVRDIYPVFERGIARNLVGELRETQLNNTNLTWTNSFNYTKTINKHEVNLLAGTEYIQNDMKSFYGFAKDFALNNNNYYQLDAAAGERSSGGSAGGYKLFSYFGKINYSFDDKYLLAATIRRDGSSRFGTDNRFAIFPAVSAGWRLKSESFLSDVSWLSDLKIRAAWGQTGNQNILNDARFQLYRAVYAPPSVYLPWGSGCTQTYCPNAPTAYDIFNANGGNLPSGFLSTQTANESLKWETTSETNVGIDFALLRDRVTGSFEVFKKTTDDILIQASQPGTYGDGSSRWTNGASMEIKGYEFNITYNSDNSRDLVYQVSVVGAHVTDEITSLPSDLYGKFPGNVEQNIVGHSPRALFGFEVDGILKDQAEVDAAPTYPGMRVGQFRYRDLNGDNKIDAADQDYQGVNGTPKLEYGINGQVDYKNFSLTLQFSGMAGRKVSSYFWQGGNQDEVLNAWTTANTGSYIPALGFGGGVSTQGGGNSYQFRNGSYFLFRQFSLGYNFPSELLQKVNWMSGLRVYVNVDNVFYLYDKKGSNRFPAEPWLLTQQAATPGAGADQSGRGQGNFETRYPKPLTISAGLNLTL